MNNSVKRKKEQLGINPGTASSQLKKSLLFNMAQKLEMDYCYHCGERIKNIKEFSIEHKIPWLDSKEPIKLYFDLDNIAFSHLSCNSRAARRKRKVFHPSQESYKRGCRCEECREIEKLRRRKQRKQGIKT